MKQLTDLLFKAYKYDLWFSYSPSVKLVDIYDFKEVDGERELTNVSKGYLDSDEGAGEVLCRMHTDMDTYMNEKWIKEGNGENA